MNACAKDAGIDYLREPPQEFEGSASVREDEIEKITFQETPQGERLHDQSHPAVVEQRDPVAAVYFVQVGGSDHDRDLVSLELIEDLPEIASRHGIDAVRRLVEEKNPRPVDQGAGETHLLLHSS